MTSTHTSRFTASRLQTHIMPREPEREPERHRKVYVTSDSSLWLVLDEPFGLISPPTIELHRPQVGTVTFYDADGYQLRIPSEARKVARHG